MLKNVHVWRITSDYIEINAIDYVKDSKASLFWLYYEMNQFPSITKYKCRMNAVKEPHGNKQQLNYVSLIINIPLVSFLQRYFMTDFVLKVHAFWLFTIIDDILCLSLPGEINQIWFSLHLYPRNEEMKFNECVL